MTNIGPDVQVAVEGPGGPVEVPAETAPVEVNPGLNMQTAVAEPEQRPGAGLPGRRRDPRRLVQQAQHLGDDLDGCERRLLLRHQHHQERHLRRLEGGHLRRAAGLGKGRCEG